MGSDSGKDRETGPRWVGVGTRCSGLRACGSSLLVGPLVWEAHSLHQLICLCGASAAADVGDGLGLLPFDLVQQRCEDAPGLLELTTAHKVRLAPTEDAQDEALTCIWELHVLVSAAIGQVQHRLLMVEEHAGLLGHHLGVHGLVGLHADHQLTALALLLEDVTGHVSELQRHLSFVLIQGFAVVQDEGHPVPPLVPHVEDDSCKGGGGGAAGHHGVVQVRFGGLTFSAGVPHVLVQDHNACLHL